MSGLLFVTAPAADNKSINRLLLHLRDWEYGSGYRFYLVTTKDVSALRAFSEENKTEPTEPPVASDISNQWKGASLQEIEVSVLELDNANDEHPVNLRGSIFVMVDEEGMQKKTCVVAERAYDHDAEQQLDAFNKVRLPWTQTYGMWCNLDIANMSFEDWCHEERDHDKDRWWEYSDAAANEMSDDKRALQVEAIKKLEDEGKA